MKYKLNEKVKKQIREQGFPNNLELEEIADADYWHNCGFDMGHLVEVKERIEVDAYAKQAIPPMYGTGCYLLCKTDKSDWSREEIEKVESALNGEVMTIKEVDKYYEKWNNDIDDGTGFYSFLKSKFQ
jgi:hypothetical protein